VRALLPLIAAACCVPPEAGAFSIATGFSTPCHEEITTTAFLLSGFDIDIDGIAIPKSEQWRQLAAVIRERHDIPSISDPVDFAFFSMYVGVRSNDTEGHSALNLASLRSIHTSVDGQDLHCLRAIDQDGPQGDKPAIEACRKFILSQIGVATSFLIRPPPEQLLTTRFTLDFFGDVPVDVWAPAYYTGRAMHTLQDSFTHTLRSEDLRRIRHVMNFVEPLGPGHDEARDGLAHSMAMDECGDPATAPMTMAAIEASGDLLYAASRSLGIRDQNEVELVLDKWLQYEEGCTIDNLYCQSSFLPHARTNVTEPFVSCSAARDASSGPGVVVALLLSLALLARRPRRLLAVIAVLAALGGCAPDEPQAVFSVKALYPVGGLGDRGFADNANTGVVVAGLTHEFALESAEPQTVEEAQKTFVDWTKTAFAGPGEEIIIAVGAPYADFVETAACDFNNRRVLLLDATATECPDLRSVEFRTYGVAFLAGVTAAAVSDTRQTAVIAGTDIAPVAELIDGFQAGLAHAGATPAAVHYLADDLSGFGDVDGAIALAEQLYGEGVDVIFPPAGAAASGVLQVAADEADRFTFGVDADQTLRAPNTVIGSLLKRLDKEIQTTLIGMGLNKFTSGSLILGMDNGGTELFINPRFGQAVTAAQGAAEAARAAEGAR